MKLLSSLPLLIGKHERNNISGTYRSVIIAQQRSFTLFFFSGVEKHVAYQATNIYVYIYSLSVRLSRGNNDGLNLCRHKKT